jgi:hypothetical protein
MLTMIPSVPDARALVGGMIVSFDSTAESASALARALLLNPSRAVACSASGGFSHRLVPVVALTPPVFAVAMRSRR